MSNHDNVLEEAAHWLGQGRRVALATVIETWGSAPRPVGSQLAIRDDATFVGSVSGGCIEGDVVTRALETLETGKTEVLEYGVTDAMAWQVGLACGGRIRVMIEPVKG
ncbi:XdhC family protein [Parvibaculum sp.]|jgi:xanthine/CO dehydrogenase XdhC/CoxF family maturation factor|uniref:XdhC family protein n=1 Tax=Parvibaculum sp. TaxID=2024848 RepID=UPI003918B77C